MTNEKMASNLKKTPNKFQTYRGYYSPGLCVIITCLAHLYQVFSHEFDRIMLHIGGDDVRNDPFAINMIIFLTSTLS